MSDGLLSHPGGGDGLLSHPGGGDGLLSHPGGVGFKDSNPLNTTKTGDKRRLNGARGLILNTTCSKLTVSDEYYQLIKLSDLINHKSALLHKTNLNQCLVFHALVAYSHQKFLVFFAFKDHFIDSCLHAVTENRTITTYTFRTPS